MSDKKTRVKCEDGEILLDGKCIKLHFNNETEDVKLKFNRNCPEDTKVAYTKIGDSLAAKRGKLIISEDEWDDD